MSTLLLSMQPHILNPKIEFNPFPNLTQTTSESESILKLLKTYSDNLTDLRRQVDSVTQSTIQLLNSSRDSFLSILSEIESKLASISLCPVPSTETLFYLSKTSKILPNLFKNSSKLFQSISELFNFPEKENFPVPSSLSSNLIFYFNQHSGVFNQIDIDSLKSSQSLTYPKFSCSYTSGVDLGLGQFFLHGGSKNYEASSETCIFDLHLNVIKKVPKSNFARSGNVCVQVGSKVFAFGSTYPVSRLCESFDLEMMTWQKISPLPQRTLFMTGSVVGGEVLLSGSGICGILRYCVESDSYWGRSVAGTTAGYKVIVENFLIDYDGIWDVAELEVGECRKYRSEWICCPVSLAISRRFRDKVYFVDCQARLVCFDPCLKTTRIIPYSNI